MQDRPARTSNFPARPPAGAMATRTVAPVAGELCRGRVQAGNALAPAGVTRIRDSGRPEPGGPAHIAQHVVTDDGFLLETLAAVR
ncbi:hypothetical protein [Streptomyces sp. SID3915]|uniref:hypothetical protein n=1 Tax=Streptomyces sp. SID3915 TaxID=2690263 RepID=UPI001F37249A|nr:hypothetical protein [Streptomyces sp. SID3915]